MARSRSGATARSGASGAPSTICTRENGKGSMNLSHARAAIHAHALALPMGTSNPDVARAAAMAPAFT